MTASRDEALAHRLAAAVDGRVALARATGVLRNWRSCGSAQARHGPRTAVTHPLSRSASTRSEPSVMAWAAALSERW